MSDHASRRASSAAPTAPPAGRPTSAGGQSPAVRPLPAIRASNTVAVVDQLVTDRYALYQGDCCELVRALPDASIHFGIHSPPFIGLYKFSGSDRDVSNSEGAAFWEHYGYLIAEMRRVTMPGRVQAVHVMQLPASKRFHGHIGIQDFRGEVVRAWCGDDAAELFEAMRRVRWRAARAAADGDEARAGRLIEAAIRIEEDLARHPGDLGFVYHSEVCIWKDPVTAQARSKSHRLNHKQLVKDSAISGQALADYILAFRRPGDNPEPVAGCLKRYVGEGDGPDQAKYTTDHDSRNWYSIEVWQRYASPVWMDIRQGDVLEFLAAKEKGDEKHISPLQLDVIGRCVDLWSNPGDIVLTPFMGIGSEVWGAVKAGRRGIGFELKASYFRQACRNMGRVDGDAPVEKNAILDALDEVAA